MTITLGWWLLPAAVTVASATGTLVAFLTEPPGGDYSPGGCLGMLTLGFGLIASLAAWCVYFALN